MADFVQLGISQEQAAALRNGGIVEPTPIQEGAIPVILKGEDVVCQAQTGTGKTLAFLLPMLAKLDPAKPKLQGLILTPTRELALQITSELKRWLNPASGFKVVAIYGGQDVEAQMRKLGSGVHIAVATPGRLLDHLRRETVSLGGVNMLVLDEADQMLHMGFLNEVEDILSKIPARRQTMLFSATMPQGVRSLAERFMNSPKDITVKAPKVTVKGIRQLVVETTDRGKQDALVRMMHENTPYLAMIFCRTKRRAVALNEALQEAGYASDELHGDLSQAKREQVMKRFREAKLQFLVATDIAARGLDVEGVTHVYNYDMPHDTESYIHRIGRTGRAGADGLAVTFATPRDGYALEAIEKGIDQKLERRRLDGGRIVPVESGAERGARGGKEGARGGKDSGRGGKGGERGSRREASQGAGRRGGASGGRGASGGSRSAGAGRGAQGAGRNERTEAPKASAGRGTRFGQSGAGRAGAGFEREEAPVRGGARTSGWGAREEVGASLGRIAGPRSWGAGGRGAAGQGRGGESARGGRASDAPRGGGFSETARGGRTGEASRGGRASDAPRGGGFGESARGGRASDAPRGGRFGEPARGGRTGEPRGGRAGGNSSSRGQGGRGGASAGGRGGSGAGRSSGRPTRRGR